MAAAEQQTQALSPRPRAREHSGRRRGGHAGHPSALHARGRDPFGEIEWGDRDAHIPGKDGPAFEQEGRRVSKFWSQTATNIVAQKYYGRMTSPERAASASR